MAAAQHNIDHLSAEERAFAAEIKAAIHEVEPDATVILFGSQARGESRSDSDWDVLVLVDSDASYPRERQMRSALFDLEVERDEVISAQMYPQGFVNAPQSPFGAQIKQDGVVL